MFTGCSHDVCISNGNIVYYDQKEFDDPQVSDDPKVISNISMDLNDPKEFDDPQLVNQTWNHCWMYF